MLAWREKYALCSLVAIVSAIFMFWLVGLDGLLCPAIPVNGLDMQIVRDSKNLVAMNGKVISLDIQDPEVKKLVDEDATMREFVKLLSSHQGKDITSLFPSFQFLAIKGTETTGVFQDPVIDKCIRSGSSGNRIRSALRFLTIWARNYGYRLNNGAIAQCPVPLGPNERPSDPPKTTACVGFSKKFQTFLKKQHVSELQIYRTEVKKDLVDDKLLDYIVIDNKVYDVSSFARIAALPVIDSNGERTTNIYEPLLDGLVNFFPDDVAKTIVNNIGFDATAAFKRIPGYQNYIPCLDRLFYAGITTDQVSDVCTFGQPLLLATAVCIYAVVGFKLILSLNFFNCCYAPGEIEKTDCVVCFVPCYTEGKDSLEKTIHSLAHANYPDNQKLIFVVCDGNLTGRGNDKSTPVYVLEILGYMGSDPEFVSYQSLGHTGPEQHNRAKVYAGWFKFDHREVPYIVVVKEGQAYEKNKPGNRGKRDSQLILMNFFSKLLQERALLTALEFDLYKKIKDTTKIEPSDYQFTLMVDADTKVDVNSLDVMIRHFKKPKSKVVALCGETRIENKWQSFITMIQVHEYYISHHLGKGFESTFG
jgi:chitin synthase